MLFQTFGGNRPEVTGSRVLSSHSTRVPLTLTPNGWIAQGGAVASASSVPTPQPFAARSVSPGPRLYRPPLRVDPRPATRSVQRLGGSPVLVSAEYREGGVSNPTAGSIIQSGEAGRETPGGNFVGVGSLIPDVTLVVRQPVASDQGPHAEIGVVARNEVGGAASELTKTTLRERLKGQRAVLFGVTGAWCPSEMQSHLAGFVAHQETLSEAFDYICCLSVNDQHVLKAWSMALGVTNLIMISDWDAKLTKSLGLESPPVEDEYLGERCSPFAMLLVDARVVWIGRGSATAVERVISEALARYESGTMKADMHAKLMLMATSANESELSVVQKYLDRKAALKNRAIIPDGSSAAGASLKAVAGSTSTGTRTPLVYDGGILPGANVAGSHLMTSTGAVIVGGGTYGRGGPAPMHFSSNSSPSQRRPPRPTNNLNNDSRNANPFSGGNRALPRRRDHSSGRASGRSSARTMSSSSAPIRSRSSSSRPSAAHRSPPRAAGQQAAPPRVLQSRGRSPRDSSPRDSPEVTATETGSQPRSLASRSSRSRSRGPTITNGSTPIPSGAQDAFPITQPFRPDGAVGEHVDSRPPPGATSAHSSQRISLESPTADADRAVRGAEGMSASRQGKAGHDPSDRSDAFSESLGQRSVAAGGKEEARSPVVSDAKSAGRLNETEVQVWGGRGSMLGSSSQARSSFAASARASGAETSHSPARSVEVRQTPCMGEVKDAGQGDERAFPHEAPVLVDDSDPSLDATKPRASGAAPLSPHDIRDGTHGTSNKSGRIGDENFKARGSAVPGSQDDFPRLTVAPVLVELQLPLPAVFSTDVGVSHLNCKHDAPLRTIMDDVKFCDVAKLDSLLIRSAGIDADVDGGVSPAETTSAGGSSPRTVIMAYDNKRRPHHQKNDEVATGPCDTTVVMQETDQASSSSHGLAGLGYAA